MSEVDKCKDVGIEGQDEEALISEGNLLEYNNITKSCTIGEKHLGNNLKVVNKKLEYKNKFYKSLPKKAHCNMYGIEKWQDWFTIPYYFINNKYQQATNEENNVGSYSVSTCYKYCGGEYVVKKNIDKCESINTFERGIYKEMLKFDPFAIICIICTKNKPGLYKEEAWVGSYEYNLKQKYFVLPDNIKKYIERTLINNLKWENVGQTKPDTGTELLQYPDLISYLDNEKTEFTHQELDSLDIKDLDIDNYIKGAENYYKPVDRYTAEQKVDPITTFQKDAAYADINASVKAAYELIVNYISDIVSNEERNDISIRNKIVNDVNRFYDLFDSRDKYYIEYLKKIKSTNSPGFGNYQGAKFAYELAQNFKKNAGDAEYGVTIKKADDSPFSEEGIDVEVKKYIRFLLIYCCNLCFSDKYLLRERLENFTIITSYEKLKEKNSTGNILSGKYEPISEDEDGGEETNESTTTNTFNVNKEEITVFEEYSYVFKYFKNVSILGPFLLLLIMIIFLGYFILDRLLLLGRFLTGVNYIYLYIVNLLMNLMYYTAINIIWFLGAVIINPIFTFSLKIPFILFNIFSMFILLLVISAIPGLEFVKDLAFMIIEFVYILIVQLVMLFFQLIFIMASYVMVSVPVTIFIVYTMHQLTYEQIGIITNPNLDFNPFISSIIMIYFQKMRNKYYINIIDNHIELINSVKPDKKTQPD
jgi:hypothetical protein